MADIVDELVSAFTAVPAEAPAAEAAEQAPETVVDTTTAQAETITPEATPEKVEAPKAEAEKPKDEVKPQDVETKEEKVVSLIEAAKAKGIADEKILKLLEVIEGNGNLNNYIKGVSEDIDAVPLPDLLKRQIDDKYSMLTEEERAELYNDELERYKIDPDLYDEADVKRGQIRMKADLHEYKQQLKENQLKQAFAEAKPSSVAAEGNQDIQAYTDKILQSEAYKGISEKGTIKIGEGNEAFNLDVDAAAIKSYLTDLDAYSAAYKGQDGQPDLGKDIRVAAYALNPAAFEAKLIAHGRKLATLEYAKEIGNENVGRSSIQAGGEPDPLAALAAMMDMN